LYRYAAPPDHSFGFLFKKLLQPLHPVLWTAPVSLQAHAIECYTAMVRTWLERSTAKATAAFQWLCYNVIRYLDRLLILLLEQSDHHPLIETVAVLLYSNLVSQMVSLYKMPFFVVPSATFCQFLILSPSAATLSLVGDLLANYSVNLQLLAQSPRHQSFIPFGDPEVQRLNSCIWNLCSLLWSQRLGTKEAAALGISEATFSRLLQTDYAAVPPLAQSFSVTRSSLFLGLATQFCATKRLPSVALLTDDLRTQFLEYLQQHGFPGITRFLYSFIGSLKRKARPGP
jgi:hypothetical protein